MGWFQEWFGTKYYNLLYEHRDYKEGQDFLDNLLSKLPLRDGDSILDVGCGNGRHSIYLASKGFEVAGIDVVENNIQAAKQFENEHLHFFQHDMRFPFPVKGFDAAMNLFTSFGYFETTEEEIRTLKNVHEALKTDGIFVIDFLNANKVADKIVPHELIVKDSVKFDISKYIKNKHIVKEIEVKNHDECLRFKEEVELLTLNDFEILFSQTGFKIKDTYGSYDMDAYDSESSDRLIMILVKA